MAFYGTFRHRVSEAYWVYNGRKAAWNDPEGLDRQLEEAANDSAALTGSIHDLPIGKGVLWAKFRTAVSLHEYPKYMEFAVCTPDGNCVLFWNAVVGFVERAGKQRAGRIFVKMDKMEGRGICSFTDVRAELTLNIQNEAFQCEWEEADYPGSIDTGLAYPAKSRGNSEVSIKGQSQGDERQGKQIRQAFDLGSAPLLVLYPEGKWTWNPVDLARRWFWDTHILCEYEANLIGILRENDAAAKGSILAALCGATVLHRRVSSNGGPP